MGLGSINLVALPLLLLLVSTINAQSTGGVIDITKYDAKPNAESSPALLKAWAEACASTTPTKVLIPKGVFKLSETYLKGPCKSSVELQLDGTLEAPIEPKGDAWITLGYIDRFTLSGSGVFDGKGEEGWKKNDCHKSKECNKLPLSLRMNFITNSIVKDITSLDSKSFHINLLGCNNLTFQDVKITAPGDSPNTDGIHIGKSVGINILNTKIATGDDCISLGDGSKQITITNVTCGPGHGISVGSLGKYNAVEVVEGVTVKNCKFTDTTNGVRIKTWPACPGTGTVSDMHFEGIEMVNVSNPVIIDQEYCPWNQCDRSVPSKIKISKVTIKNIKGSSATPVGVKLVCSKSHPCEGVEVANIDLTYSGSEGPIRSECLNVTPTLSGVQNPKTCATVASENTPSAE